jgi:hypothetical protein
MAEKKANFVPVSALDKRRNSAVSGDLLPVRKRAVALLRE